MKKGPDPYLSNSGSDLKTRSVENDILGMQQEFWRIFLGNIYAIKDEFDHFHILEELPKNYAAFYATKVKSGFEFGITRDDTWK